MDTIVPPDLTTGAPVSPEQAADLANLAAMIEPDPVLPGEPGTPPATDYTTEASGAVEMLAALIVGYEPKCLPLWDDPRKAGIAAALAPVMEKYNFSLGKIPPEITLLIIIAPPLYQSSKIIAEGMNKREAEAKPAALVAEAGAAPTGATHDAAMMGLAL